MFYLREAIACLTIGLTLTSLPLIAQEATTQEQKDKEAALEKEALNLLDVIIGEAHSLRLADNRIRIQLTAADLLWVRDQERARALFLQAAGGIAEMMRSVDTNDRQYFNQMQIPNMLRRSLLTTAARRDASLAYEMMLSTRQPQVATSTQNFRGQVSEANLEMELLAEIAASDPKLALKNAEEAIDKGQFPRTLARVLDQLNRKDKESASKLADKMTRKLRSETLLANQEAAGLSLELLRAGPRPAEARVGRPASPARGGQVLDEASFKALMEAVISAALGAPSRPAGRASSRRGGIGGGAQDAAESSQRNARSLLMGLRSLLSQVDKYLPGRSQAVRQKLGEAGIRVESRQPFEEFNDLARNGSVEAILQAAPTAPASVQSRLYLQAALKAARENNGDVARQIANDHLEPGQRNIISQELERQQALRQAAAGEIGGVQQILSGMRSDRDRVGLLVQMANSAVQKKDQKLAAQLLQEARTLGGRRAENYQQLETQLAIARAYIAVDPSQAAELLELGIGQLNELVAAAAVLSGFEVRIFRDGELPIQGGNSLSNIVGRYGDELARLARIDLGRAQMAADRFQRSEPRIIVRMSIVRGILAGPATVEQDPFSGRSFRGIGAARRP